MRRLDGIGSPCYADRPLAVVAVSYPSTAEPLVSSSLPSALMRSVGGSFYRTFTAHAGQMQHTVEGRRMDAKRWDWGGARGDWRELLPCTGLQQFCNVTRMYPLPNSRRTVRGWVEDGVLTARRRKKQKHSGLRRMRPLLPPSPICTCP